MLVHRVFTLLLSTALLLGGATVLAAPAQAAETTLSTRVVYDLSKNRMRFGDKFRVQGQVLTELGGETHFVEGAPVALQRRFPGKAWQHVGRTTASHQNGVFTFTGVVARQNAAYRVVYAKETRTYGGEQVTFTGSTSAAKGIKVLRKFVLGSRRAKGGMVFTGRVAPQYKNRVVQVLQRKCARCAWKPFTKVRTNKRSRFSTRVALPPRRGRTWDYRVRTPRDRAFLASASTRYLSVWRY